jgi:hypothetical protein
MSAPGASPEQDLSKCPINFLVRDVDIEFAAFLEAQARAAPVSPVNLISAFTAVRPAVQEGMEMVYSEPDEEEEEEER